MKTNKIYSSILLLLFVTTLVFSFTSCKEEEPKPNTPIANQLDSIVGTYMFNYDYQLKESTGDGSLFSLYGIDSLNAKESMLWGENIKNAFPDSIAYYDTNIAIITKTYIEFRHVFTIHTIPLVINRYYFDSSFRVIAMSIEEPETQMYNLGDIMDFKTDKTYNFAGELYPWIVFKTKDNAYTWCIWLFK